MAGNHIEPVYFKNRDIPGQSNKKTSGFEVCKAAANVVENRSIEGAQLVRGVWKLYLKSQTSRMKVLTHGLAIREVSVTIYDSNPYARTFDDTPAEKITLKDLPLSFDNVAIEQFLKDHEGLSLKSNIRFGKEKDYDGNWTQYKNGDRYLYALAPVIPALPREAMIDGVPCRIFHNSQDDTCKSCKESGHKAGDENCPALDRSGSIQPFKTHENILSNYAPCKLTYLGAEFASLEHLYQWLKANDLGMEALAEQIRHSKHAGAARAIARDNIDSDMAKDWEKKSISTMYKCLEVKALQCTEFKEALIESGNNILVEATSDIFWGAGMDPYTVSITKQTYWPGENRLGDLLMKLRHNLPELEDTFDDSVKVLAHSSPVRDVELIENQHSEHATQSSFDTQQTLDHDTEKAGNETSLIKKVGSFLKHKSNTQLNKIEKYLVNPRETHKKRRASTSPPKTKYDKQSRSDETECEESSQFMDRSHSLLTGKIVNGKTNHDTC